MAHADELLGVDDGRQEGRPFIGMQIDEDIVVMLMQVPPDTPQARTELSLPFLSTVTRWSILGL